MHTWITIPCNFLRLMDSLLYKMRKSHGNFVTSSQKMCLQAAVFQTSNKHVNQEKWQAHLPMAPVIVWQLFRDTACPCPWMACNLIERLVGTCKYFSADDHCQNMVPTKGLGWSSKLLPLTKYTFFLNIFILRVKKVFWTIIMHKLYKCNVLLLVAFYT